MKGTKMKLFAAAAAIGVLVTLTLSASTASAAADKCRGKKIKAIGKKESRLLGCSGKEATQREVSVGGASRAAGGSRCTAKRA